MTADTTIYLYADNLDNAQAAAKTTAAALGASSHQLATAAAWTAATHPARLPAEVDYFGYQPGQGIPAWVQVLDLRSTGARDMAARDAAPTAAWEATQIANATHQVRITHAHRQANITSAVDYLTARFPGIVVHSDYTALDIAA
ncbi:MAG: hypothetical protein L0H59_13520 [Tomitella sp.]|nr:hypothetical protein [Tomitella sp.]